MGTTPPLLNWSMILDQMADKEVDGYKSEQLRQAARRISDLESEVELLGRQLNEETANRFAADNPPILGDAQKPLLRP